MHDWYWEPILTRATDWDIENCKNRGHPSPLALAWLEPIKRCCNHWHITTVDDVNKWTTTNKDNVDLGKEWPLKCYWASFLIFFLVLLNVVKVYLHKVNSWILLLSLDSKVIKEDMWRYWRFTKHCNALWHWMQNWIWSADIIFLEPFLRRNRPW